MCITYGDKARPLCSGVNMVCGLNKLGGANGEGGLMYWEYCYIAGTENSINYDYDGLPYWIVTTTAHRGKIRGDK